MKAGFLLLSLIVIACTKSFGQVTALDSTFAINGMLKLDSPAIGGSTSIALQPDGRIVSLAGYVYYWPASPIYYGLAIRRFLPDGSVDFSFNGTGSLYEPVDDYITASGIRVQPDGKLLVLGSTGHYQGHSAVLLRYLPDGRPDSGFNGTGRIDFQHGTQDGLYDLELQPDGKVVLTGGFTSFNSYHLAIYRFRPDGSPDSTFGYFGALQTLLPTAFDFGGSDICVQPDGRLIVTGTSIDLPGPAPKYQFTVARYDSVGLLDGGFHFGDGYVTQQFPKQYRSVAYKSALRPDGKILVAGNLTYRYDGAAYCTLLQLLPNGRIDSSWGTNGTVVVDSLLEDIVYDIPKIDLQVLADNKILVSFGHSVTPGKKDFALYRLLPNGHPDLQFGLYGLLTTSLSAKNSYTEQVLVQADGKILVAGQYEDAGFKRHQGMVRYRPNIKLGVPELPAADYGLKVYPNPLVAASILSYELKGPEIITIDLWDATGRKVRCLQPPVSMGKGQHTLPLTPDEALSPGLYVLSLCTGKGAQAIRILKR